MNKYFLFCCFFLTHEDRGKNIVNRLVLQKKKGFNGIEKAVTLHQTGGT